MKHWQRYRTHDLTREKIGIVFEYIRKRSETAENTVTFMHDNGDVIVLGFPDSPRRYDVMTARVFDNLIHEKRDEIEIAIITEEFSDVDGIGSETVENLYRNIGTIEDIREAELEELLKVNYVTLDKVRNFPQSPLL